MHPTLQINQQQSTIVTSHKHICLTFSNDLSWHEHFYSIKTNSRHRINAMCKLKFQLDRKSLQPIYVSLIRPSCGATACSIRKPQHVVARILSLAQQNWFPLNVSKGAKIRNRYNQVPHLTQDTNGKVTNSQLDTTNESQEVSPFSAGDHKAHINRRAQRHSKHKTEKT